MLTDELGFSLLQLSGGSSRGSATTGGGAQSPGPSTSTQNSPAVLSAVLNLFGALVQTAGPCMRILVESFVRQVYLKALIQTYDLFLDQVNSCSVFLIINPLRFLIVFHVYCTKPPVAFSERRGGANFPIYLYPRWRHGLGTAQFSLRPDC